MSRGAAIAAMIAATGISVRSVDLRNRRPGRRTIQGRKVERCPRCGEAAIYVASTCVRCNRLIHVYCHVVRYDRKGELDPVVMCLLHPEPGIN